VNVNLAREEFLTDVREDKDVVVVRGLRIKGLQK